ncbi:TetR/AcrR family transcriptional regulator [Actinoalloteichus spitiensis]|uniref:TetR/AcrR family transcriptional regulator n=1 Tax=Actinoalloteichus spitiensis TaxID=252394 RepID=UPI000373A834|nr:TetR family transcriptional regulator [Actinoalloteichus spitiensis]
MGDEGTTTDGRRVRGQRRRAQIIEATLTVVRRDGAAGVTHRAVAKEAGITTSLTTYYFATLDDLLVAALTEVADTYTEHIRRIMDTSDDPVRDFAALVAASAGEGRERALAERELSTLAARRPALRPVARRWRERVADLAWLRTSDPRAVEVFVAVSEGLCAAILLDEGRADPEHVRAVLERALAGG